MSYRLEHEQGDELLGPLNEDDVLEADRLPLRLCDYVQLLDQSGGLLLGGSVNQVAGISKLLEDKFQIPLSGYTRILKNLSGLFYRVVGPRECMKGISELLGVKWLKGQGMARQLFGR